MEKINEKALLCNLRISHWTARKSDRAISAQVEHTHNAHNAGNYTKKLIDDAELKNIQNIVGAARNHLYKNTLPWGDSGDRILQAKYYFEFLGSFTKFQDDFSTAVNNFIAAYPILKSEAKIRLNDLFCESDYPTSNQLAKRFDMTLTFLPISNLTDFRLNINENEIEKLKSKMEIEISARFTEATKEIWQRISEAVQHMSNKLADKDAIFRNSLVGNIEELITVLPRLNIADDPNITATIQDMKKLICDPEQLRSDSSQRSKTAKEAQIIVDRISEYL